MTKVLELFAQAEIGENKPLGKLAVNVIVANNVRKVLAQKILTHKNAIPLE